MSTRSGRDYGTFNGATPFPTDLPYDRLLREAVRLSNVIARHEADISSGGNFSEERTTPAASGSSHSHHTRPPTPPPLQAESPLSPLTASSSGTPEQSNAQPVAPEDVAAALDALLDAIDELRVAPDFTDDEELSAEEGEPVGYDDRASSPEYEDPLPAAGADPSLPNLKRKRRGARGKGKAKGKNPAHNNGQGAGTSKEKERQRAKKQRTRQEQRERAANAPPYERRHPKSFYKKTHCLRLLNLRSFEIKYVTSPGGYVGKKWFGKRVHTVEQLKEMGFVELEWDGEDTIVILDKDSRVVVVLVGRPQGMTDAERKEWDAGMEDLARAFEEERTLHQRDFKNHGRGAFAAFATGFSMGPGSTTPGNLGYERTSHRGIAERLLAHGQLRRLAGFASEAVAHYFPLAFLHMRNRLAALCKNDPSLKFPFGGISLYPACTFNLGPFSVCYAHTDGSNYPGFPCTVSAAGNFNSAKGGHFILFDFKLYFKFPSGTTVLLSSAGLRHGNTRLAPGDKRYSFTQYCAGSLIRWVANGFRLVKGITDAERERIDAEMGEGWEAQLSRLSVWSNLLVDRKTLYTHERK